MTDRDCLPVAGDAHAPVVDAHFNGDDAAGSPMITEPGSRMSIVVELDNRIRNGLNGTSISFRASSW